MSDRLHTVAAEEAGQRLDVAVSRLFPDLTRSQAQRLIEMRLVTVDDRPEKNNYRLKAGQRLGVVVPHPVATETVPENIPLVVVYEDSDIVVVNKPAGLVVHPAAGNWHGTLVNALLYHIGGLSGIGGEVRPGIVHRLDKDTSGLLVVAKNDFSHLELTRQLASRAMGREYLALVHGVIRQEMGTIDIPIGRHPVHRKEMAVRQDGRPARTHFAVLERFMSYTLVRCKLDTGRTHQIRVHMNHVAHPIVGDPVYGPRQGAFGRCGQLLHAIKLTLCHPRSKEPMEFSCELPLLFAGILTKLRANQPTRPSLSTEDGE
ncbi:MAG: Ribosomal large subunit pseudouridine synthase D [Firmicutes bacterium]|nr:Ribosomal large subunit pseudouridine synthase D [Bacillota bacterium]